jgi:hypothetical protein
MTNGTLGRRLACQGLATVPSGLGYRLGWWAVGPVSSFIVLAGAEVLRGIVATARAGARFVAAYVRRIRVLAALTLGYFVLAVTRSLWRPSSRTTSGSIGRARTSRSHRSCRP